MRRRAESGAIASRIMAEGAGSTWISVVNQTSPTVPADQMCCACVEIPAIRPHGALPLSPNETGADEFWPSAGALTRQCARSVCSVSEPLRNCAAPELRLRLRTQEQEQEFCT